MYQKNNKKMRQLRKQYYHDNKEKSKQYYENNKKHIKQYNLKYRKDNNKKIRQRLEKNKDHSNNYQNNYRKLRRKTDSSYAVLCRIRYRLSGAFKLYSKNGKAKSSDEYGINYKAIIEHLKPFPAHRELFHIDHIKPLASFDFSKESEIRKAFVPENHQWLLAEENLKKGSKIENQEILIGGCI